MTTGVKHLVTCRCTLPQFKRSPSPPMHQFVVFSIIDDENNVTPKYAQCNNCGIIHRVVEINRSVIVSDKESMTSIVSIDDIRASLPPRLVELLDGNNADLATWEAAKDIIKNKRWGEFLVLTSESDQAVRTGKYVRILGENMFDVDGFEREEVVK
jgi:hypothetical protein